ADLSLTTTQSRSRFFTATVHGSSPISPRTRPRRRPFGPRGHRRTGHTAQASPA
ncbi:unnamed protein product, partial [Symbiodinium sp. KB8]